MKWIYRIIRGLFAIIGLLTVMLLVWMKISGQYITIHEGDKLLYPARVDSLRAAGAYGADTVDFSMRIVQDSVRAKEIREYFQLDTLYTADSPTWEKAVAIASFVERNIPHANQKVEPEHRNAIALWEYTREVEPGFNCRLHSILTFELMLAAGLTPKFVTCLPQDRNDPDCHVVNEVWLPELGKWAMIDSDMGGHYVSDENDVPLSLAEMRDHYIAGEKMWMHPGFGKGSNKLSQYYAYMAKNTYWFMCEEELTYGVEDHPAGDTNRGRMLNLIPTGFVPFGIWDNSVNTTNAERFWAKPEHQKDPSEDNK